MTHFKSRLEFRLSIGSNNHSQASVFQHNQILNSKQNELGRFQSNIILDE